MWRVGEEEQYASEEGWVGEGKDVMMKHKRTVVLVTLSKRCKMCFSSKINRSKITSGLM